MKKLCQFFSLTYTFYTSMPFLNTITISYVSHKNLLSIVEVKEPYVLDIRLTHHTLQKKLDIRLRKRAFQCISGHRAYCI